MGNYLVSYFFFKKFGKKFSLVFKNIHQGVSGEEESEKNEGYDPKRIYWDADGNLRHGKRR